MEYFTSDTHFNHSNIIKYCDRPFASLEEMNAAIIKRWNDRVSQTDTVYHLGDFCMGANWREQAAQFRQQLNGRVVLVLGNHDRGTAKMLELGFDEVVEDRILERPQGRLLLRHAPGEGHAPDAVPAGFDYLLHGHVHTQWCRKDRLINVGVDVWDFTPRTLDELLRSVRL